MKLGAINHIALTVSNLERSEAFYNALLGFMGYEQAEKTPQLILWTSSNGVISISPSQPESANKKCDRPSGDGCNGFAVAAAAEPPAKNPLDFLPPPGALRDRYSPGLHHLAFSADSREEVDQLYQYLLKLKAEILDSPAEYDYMPGYYAVYFLDPDEIKLELTHIPNWPPEL